MVGDGGQDQEKGPIKLEPTQSKWVLFVQMLSRGVGEFFSPKVKAKSLTVKDVLDAQSAGAIIEDISGGNERVVTFGVENSVKK